MTFDDGLRLDILVGDLVYKAFYNFVSRLEAVVVSLLQTLQTTSNTAMV